MGVAVTLDNVLDLRTPGLHYLCYDLDVPFAQKAGGCEVKLERVWKAMEERFEATVKRTITIPEALWKMTIEAKIGKKWCRLMLNSAPMRNY